MRHIIISLLIATGAMIASTTAHAYESGQNGRWVLNPAKCPDLIEDRRDRRESRRDEAYDFSRRDIREDRRDRRESRRDEAVIRCPASAFEWRGAKYRRDYHPARPHHVVIRYHAKSRSYYRYGQDRGKIVIRF